jgi:hypothetical protein
MGADLIPRPPGSVACMVCRGCAAGRSSLGASRFRSARLIRPPYQPWSRRHRACKVRQPLRRRHFPLFARHNKHYVYLPQGLRSLVPTSYRLPSVSARPPPGAPPWHCLRARAAARHKARGGPPLPALAAGLISFISHPPPWKRNPVDLIFAVKEKTIPPFLLTARNCCIILDGRLSCKSAL